MLAASPLRRNCGPIYSQLLESYCAELGVGGATDFDTVAEFTPWNVAHFPPIATEPRTLPNVRFVRASRLTRVDSASSRGSLLSGKLYQFVRGALQLKRICSQSRRGGISHISLQNRGVTAGNAPHRVRHISGLPWPGRRPDDSAAGRLCDRTGSHPGRRVFRQRARRCCRLFPRHGPRIRHRRGRRHHRPFRSFGGPARNRCRLTPSISRCVGRAPKSLCA
jgi:hypothetical protein